MDDSSRPKRGEAREFWEAAIRLWAESGVSVREFCRREGLAEHTFYSWRRELRPKGQGSETGQEATVAGGGRVAGAGRRRRKRKQVADDGKTQESVTDSFIELVSPDCGSVCQCTLELENTDGSKMRVQLRSITTPDLAAISRSFWNPTP